MNLVHSYAEFARIAKGYLDCCRKLKVRCRPSSEDETQCTYCIERGIECTTTIRQPKTVLNKGQSNTYANTQENVFESDPLQPQLITDDWGFPQITDDWGFLQITDDWAQAYLAHATLPPAYADRPGSVASFSSAGSHNVSPWT